MFSKMKWFLLIIVGDAVIFNMLDHFSVTISSYCTNVYFSSRSRCIARLQFSFPKVFPDES